MPRFFFHIHDPEPLPDEDGLDLPDAEAARHAAVAGLRGLAADQVKDGRLDLRQRIEIADSAGAPVATVLLRDVLRIDR